MYDTQHLDKLCTCAEAGALAAEACAVVDGKQFRSSRTDLTVKVKAIKERVGTSETVTFALVLRNQTQSPIVVGMDLFGLVSVPKLAVFDARGKRADRPADNARCQNNDLSDKSTPNEPLTPVVLVPGAALGWRLPWVAVRSEWGAHRGHVSAAGIPTCEYKKTAAPLAAGRYSGLIATGIVEPKGLSSVRIPFAIKR